MQLRPDQLERHLAEQLAPVYLVSGDEPLQKEESLDRIRAAARGRGFTERTVLIAETGFDWSQLQASGDSFSLFAERKLIDLRIPSGKPGDAGSRALVEYLERLSPDNLLLVSTGQVEARVRRTKWYRALEGAGVAILTWPVDAGRLRGWIQQRARARGWRLDEGAADELAVRTEGNLLACAQEIELLGLLHGDRLIDAATVLAVAADRARFETFDLVDATLDGDLARTARVLRGLEREGVAPSVVAGTIAWQMRALAELARHPQLDQALRANPVWARRRAGVQRALRRHPARFWEDALLRLRAVDAAAKGARDDDPWQSLLGLCMHIAGLALLPGPAL